MRSPGPATPRRATRRPSDRGPGRGAFEAVHALVRRIPRGRVMTYGQIAEILGSPLSARAVGWALHGCPEDVPWQRVVNAAGACSTDGLPGTPPGLQRALLEREGVAFGTHGRLDLERYRWAPRARPARRAGASHRRGMAATRK